MISWTKVWCWSCNSAAFNLNWLFSFEVHESISIHCAVLSEHVRLASVHYQPADNETDKQRSGDVHETNFTFQQSTPCCMKYTEKEIIFSASHLESGSQRNSQFTTTESHQGLIGYFTFFGCASNSYDNSDHHFTSSFGTSTYFDRKSKKEGREIFIF